MKDVDYLKLCLEQNISVSKYLERKCDEVLSYHSYSPQYSFYYNEFSSAMDKCVYDGLISPKYYEKLMNRIKYSNDTNSRNLVAPIMKLLDRYKPRLKIIDLLYDIDLERTYILKLVCVEMDEVFDRVNSFSSMFNGRQMAILDSLDKALATIDSPNRECYYYLYLARTALIISTKYYRSGESNDLVDLYLEISTKVHKQDEKFFEKYERALREKNLNIRDSEFFTVDTSSKYSYMDYLNDYDLLFKSLACPGNKPIIEECNSRLISSKLPNYLKDDGSKKFYDLNNEFINEDVSIASSFAFYDLLGKDFIYYLNIKTFNESKIVVNTFNNILQEDNLVEFYVNKACMSSLGDGGDDLTYNIVLLENLEKLNSYGFIDDVSYYFGKYRR